MSRVIFAGVMTGACFSAELWFSAELVAELPAITWTCFSTELWVSAGLSASVLPWHECGFDLNSEFSVGWAHG
jgi:hypothetical protein